MAPRQTAARVTLRLGLLAQVARKRAVLDAGGCLSGHQEGRFTDTLPGLAYGASTPRFRRQRRHLRRVRFHPTLGAWFLPASGRLPVKPVCGETEFATSLCRTVGLYVLVLS
ncbi:MULTISPECIES: hypothetical protein [Alcaligenaceae]|jgi:hypothetical protein|uniref:Uncharacterized protein n=1 Tax=Pollutimonas thiosulfatoxidans TaxID=2028345 RepID=A0A410GCE5_9BURK|nr:MULTISPECIES: hypothetical protein [Alcaligenaceae]QAA93955.1 hypothetical protein CKA81_08980 [Pollutimonas thiosulfatoxidans]TEA79718.1 hypothetical protein ERE07_01890 [Allopusillimonas ginsengisoli]UTM02341.1 hypothetical protein MID00_02690 [Alcaligenes sp. NLF5-7]